MERRHFFYIPAGLVATALHKPLQAQQSSARSPITQNGGPPVEMLEFDGWIVSRADKLALLKLHLSRLEKSAPRDEGQILQTRQAIESLSPPKPLRRRGF